MLYTLDQLEAGALTLPTLDRAHLIERLIASLGVEPSIEMEWVSEVERRNAEVESGAVELLPGPETLALLRAEFQ